MSHPDEGVLQELLDGELAPADAAAVRAHLAGCVPCAVILRDLGATQAEADAIVSRLPLDPPLVRPGTRAPGRRPINLRMIGLAASIMLVAGTSWMLLRTTRGDTYRRGSEDSGAGLALPMPTEERQEAPATTPATPPPPAAAARAERAGAGAGAGADRSETAKQAPREAEKKEKDAEDFRQSEIRLQANAAPAAAAQAPARVMPGALKATAGVGITVADAETRLGTRLRRISGLTPVSVEVLPVAADSLPTVRQQYLVSGVPVVLVQQALPATRDEVASKGRDAAGYVDGVLVEPGNRGNGFVAAAESGKAAPVRRSWSAWGSRFVLQGALPADSIDALMKRVE